MNTLKNILMFPLNFLRGIGIVLAVFFRLPAEAKSNFFVGMWTMFFIIGVPIIYIKGVYDDEETDKKRDRLREVVSYPELLTPDEVDEKYAQYDWSDLDSIEALKSSEGLSD